MMRMASSLVTFDGTLAEHGRVRDGEDAVGLRHAFAEQPATHVALGVEGVPASRPPTVDLRDGQRVGSLSGWRPPCLAARWIMLPCPRIATTR